MIRNSTKTTKALAVLTVLILLATVCLGFTYANFAYAKTVKPNAAESIKLNSANEENYDVVTVTTAQELKALSYYINNIGTGNNMTYYRLNSDIDLTGFLSESGDGYTAWGAEGFMPIGYKGAGKEMPFAGVFDGNGYTIKGLWINRPNNECETGLFGYNTGTIKNLNIKLDEGRGGTIGKNFVGAVAGINDGLIENCTVNGQISGKTGVGGIAGENNGSVINCENFANISGKTSVGGIVGENENLIERCQNSGLVTGGEYGYSIGGIAGMHSASLTGDIIPTISECANFANISGETWIGGISGYVRSANIVDCLNASLVEGQDIIGGIAGYFGNTTLKNCLNVGAVNGKAEVGGIAGKIRGADIINCYFDADRIIILLVGNGGQDEDEKDEPKGIGLTANELITREFLQILNSSGEMWQFFAPDDFHYYPMLKVFSDQSFRNSNLQTNVAAYTGVPVLTKATLTYGEALNTISFTSDENGEFCWTEPNKILTAGANSAYAEFRPNGTNFGALYDIEIQINVLKAQSSVLLSIENWTAGKTDNAPQVEIAAGERKETDLIIEYKQRGKPDSKYSALKPSKAGKYTARVIYPESDNYLTGYAVYDFEIKPDLTWAVILASILGGLALAAVAIYFTDKKFRYFAQLKKLLIKEVVVEKTLVQEVMIEKQGGVIDTAGINTLIEKLTKREYEVAEKIVLGLDKSQIAEELSISLHTLRKHIENILSKTDCKNQREFIVRYRV